MKYLRRQNIIYLILAFLLLIGGILLHQFKQTKRHNELQKKEMEAQISQFVDEVERASKNDVFSDEVIEGKWSDIYLDKSWRLLIYRDDSLIYWNNNDEIPYSGTRNFSNGTSFEELKTGEFVAHVVEKRSFTYLGLLPIRYDYVIDNQFLQKNFNPLFQLNEKVRIVEKKLGDNSFEIKANGKTLFHLDFSRVANISSIYHLGYILKFLGLLILLAVISLYCRRMAKDGKGSWAALILCISILVIFQLAKFLSFPSGLSSLSLFDPKLYGSAKIAGSLGDLFLILSVVLWFVVFFMNNIKVRVKSDWPLSRRYLVYAPCILVLYIASYYLLVIMKSLVLDSHIRFYVTELINPAFTTIIGFGCISLLIISFFFVIQKISFILSELGLTLQEKILGVLPILIGVVLVQYFYMSHDFELIVNLWLIAFLLLGHYYSIITIQDMTFGKFVFWLILFASLSTFILHHYSDQREIRQRKAFAEKYKLNSDPYTQLLFNQESAQIANDNIVKNYLEAAPFLRNFTSLEDQLRKRYFYGYFNKYDIEIHVKNGNGQFIKSTSSRPRRKQIKENEIHNSLVLKQLNSKAGSISYRGFIPVKHKSKVLGEIVIDLKQKSYNPGNVYPTLVAQDSQNSYGDYGAYSYAIYSNNKLEDSSGDYDYERLFSAEFNNVSKNELMELNGYSHYITENSQKDRDVIVSLKEASLAERLSLFSFLCLFLIAMTVFFLIIYTLIRIVAFRLNIRRTILGTLKNRLNVSMLSIVIISFILIGVVSVYYFTSEFESYHNSRLYRKQSSVLKNMKFLFLDENGDGNLSAIPTKEVQDKIYNLSDIHSLDINVYDLEAYLLDTSQPSIFSNGLKSRQMAPEAVIAILQNQENEFIQTEKIGSLEYLSAYSSLRNKDGELLAILNLPYFKRSNNLREDISSFLVVILNVYMILLFGAGLLSVFLSENLTRSLTMISNRIKGFELGKNSEPLYWEYDDEIGLLVKEYNKMIEQVELSAGQLASAEKQMAWREMARQIAHEIKNPLTPMKLSIQHLKRAAKENHPDLEAMTDKVSNTLIEQIDNLAHIASEFSNFANMPRGDNELIDVKEVLDSVVTLFEKTKHVSFVRNITPEDCNIYADKNQLIQVFNNIIKNAVQAIPEEEEGVVDVVVAIRNEVVKIEIKDNGVGISDAQAEKVFVPNFTTKTSGTGLGLAISKKIIEGINGTIAFDSVLGEGTTFRVLIPLYNNNGADFQ